MPPALGAKNSRGAHCPAQPLPPPLLPLPRLEDTTTTEAAAALVTVR
jgi:hypothetical protein